MKQVKKPKRTLKRWWRVLIVGVLMVLATVTLVSGIVTRYVRDNLLDTDGYLAIVGPLPQEPTVATALATFTTTKLFDVTKTEDHIKEFLPPRLEPLASPLTTALQENLSETTANFVSGDTFSNIWRTANRTTHQKIMEVAKSKKGEDRLAAVGSLNLGPLLEQIRGRFGNNQTILTDQQKDAAAEIQVNLHQSVEQLRKTVSIIQGSASALPFISLALLLSAIAVAYNRRRAVMVVGILLMILGVVLLVGFNTFSNNALGDITNHIYRAAAETIYHAFYGDLQRRLVLAFCLGLGLFGLALVAGPYSWAKRFRAALQLPAPYRKKMHQAFWTVKVFCQKHYIKLESAAGLLAILALFFISSVSSLTIALSVLVSFVALLHIIIRQAPSEK